MFSAPLGSIIMKDGSRHFLSLSAGDCASELQAKLERIPGIRVCAVTQGGFQWRMTFQCLGWRFAINNPFGELWFFVEDPDCPEYILRCLRRRLSGIIR